MLLFLCLGCKILSGVFALPGIHSTRESRWRSLLLCFLAMFAHFFLLGGMVAQSSPSSPAAALAFERDGKFSEAADAWRSVIKANPNDAAAWASLGVNLSRLQRYPEAATAYRKALALDSRLPGIHLNLGLAEFKRGEFRSAISPLRAALAGDPKSQQARTLLGMSYYGAGQFAEAAKELTVATDADPTNIELRQVLAQSCLWAKKYSCALDQFQAILRTNPDSAAAHILTGEALDGLGR